MRVIPAPRCPIILEHDISSYLESFALHRLQQLKRQGHISACSPCSMNISAEVILISFAPLLDSLRRRRPAPRMGLCGKYTR